MLVTQTEILLSNLWRNSPHSAAQPVVDKTYFCQMLNTFYILLTFPTLILSSPLEDLSNEMSKKAFTSFRTRPNFEGKCFLQIQRHEKTLKMCITQIQCRKNVTMFLPSELDDFKSSYFIWEWTPLVLYIMFFKSLQK